MKHFLYTFLLIGSFGLMMGQTSKPRQWERKRIDAQLTTRDGLIHQGQLIVALDTALVFWASRDPFQPNQASELKSYAPTDLISLRLRRKSQLLRGLGIGAGIGVAGGGIVGGVSEPGIFGRAYNIIIGGLLIGAPTALIGALIGSSRQVKQDILLNGRMDAYTSVLSTLQKKYAFYRPEEVNFSIPSLEQLPPGPIPDPEPESNPSFDISRLHISGGFGRQFTGVGRGSIRAYEDIGAEEFTGISLGGENLVFQFGLGYTLNSKLRLGFDWLHTNGTITGGQKSDPARMLEISLDETYQTDGLVLSVVYVPRPIDRLLASSWEWSIGGGLALQRLRVEQNIFAFQNVVSPNALSYSGSQESMTWQPGLAIRLSGAYYFTQFLSLQAQLNAQLVPNTTLPQQALLDEQQVELISLPEHPINASPIQLLLSLQVHLFPKSFR